MGVVGQLRQPCTVGAHHPQVGASIDPDEIGHQPLSISRDRGCVLVRVDNPGLRAVGQTPARNSRGIPEVDRHRLQIGLIGERRQRHVRTIGSETEVRDARSRQGHGFRGGKPLASPLVNTDSPERVGPVTVIHVVQVAAVGRPHRVPIDGRVVGHWDRVFAGHSGTGSSP